MLLTVTEVGERLKVSSSFIYRLVAAGQPAVMRVGNGHGRIRIAESDLQAYLDAHRVDEHGSRKQPGPALQKLQHLKLPRAFD